MSKKLLVVTLIVATVSIGAWAQMREGEIGQGHASVQNGIDRAGDQLEQIALVLREIRADQKVLLMIRRIELAERRLEPLNGELRRAREDVRSLEQEIAQMEGIADSFRNEIEEAVRTGADPLQLPARAELERIGTMLDLLRERQEDAERRVIEAENDLDRRERRVAVLDEMLEELLESLGE